MRKKIKQTLSFLLTFVMLCGLLPMTAMAAPDTIFTDKETAKEKTSVVADKTVSGPDAEGNYTITLSVTGTTDESSETTQLPADIVLVVDTSGSMDYCGGTLKKDGTFTYKCDRCNETYLFFSQSYCTNQSSSTDRMDAAQTAATTFVNGLLGDESEFKVGLVNFSGVADSTQLVDKNGKRTLLDQITGLEPNWGDNAGTNYQAALEKAEELLKTGTNTQKFIVFLSDGEPGWGQDGTTVADRLKIAGVTIMTVGIDTVNESMRDALRNISSTKKEGTPYYYESAGTEAALQAIIEEITEIIPQVIYAGKNGIMTDVINTKSFELVSGSASDNLTVGADGKTLTWNIGNIGKEKQTVSFQIKLKDGNTASGDILTNDDVKLAFDSTKLNDHVIFEKSAIGEPIVTVQGKYRLTYNANGGIGAPTASEGHSAGDTVTLSTEKPTTTEKVVFVGWSETETEYSVESPATEEVATVGTVTFANQDITVHAVWAEDKNGDGTPDYEETQPIVVSVYRNSNTETPIFSKQVDELAKGETFNLSKLEGILADADITGEEGVDYEFDGWYNDGGWNNYLQGNPDNTLGESITINGWTNIKCMVTDYVPIHVYAVVDGDQANAEEIYSDKALMGENLLDYLNANVPEKAANWDRDGYDRDLWYNWDWFGHKFNDETKVNGWTKVYVTYTSQEQVAQMVIYRNGNMEEPYQTVSLNDKLDGVKKNDVIQLNGKEQTISLNGKTVALEDYYTPDKFANGYVFDGWFNDGAWNQYKDGETVEGLNEITVNGWTNIIVMVWDEFPVYYHIDGEMVHTDTITAKDLDSYEFYQPDPREDYTFDGWYEKESDIGNENKKADLPLSLKKYELYGRYDAEKQPEDKTLNIYWSIDKPEGASFVLSEESSYTETFAWADRDHDILLPEVEVEDGYRLAGWTIGGEQSDYLDADTESINPEKDGYIVETENGGFFSVTANIVKEDEPIDPEQKYMVHFYIANENGADYIVTEDGKEIAVDFVDVEAVYDADQDAYVVTFPELDLASNYRLIGWQLDGNTTLTLSSDAQEYVGVENIANDGHLAITALVERRGGSHHDWVTLTYDENGGKELGDEVYERYEEAELKTPERSGYRFVGWYWDEDLEDKIKGDTIEMDQDYTIYAKWDKKSSGNNNNNNNNHDNDKDKDQDAVNRPDATPDALNGDDHFDYVVGDADGLVHPERNITRAEVASIFFRLLKDDIRAENLTNWNTFYDVSVNEWFHTAISTMANMDIVYGRENGNFEPNAYITRAEFAAIAARFDSERYDGENLFNDISGHWAADQINRAAEKGWITGYPNGNFEPDRYITRAEAITMINRVLNRIPEDVDALHEDMRVWPDNMDTNAWYYLAIQEATNYHEYEKDDDGLYETWTKVLPSRDWAQYLN